MFLIIAALYGFISVAAGAFGAHALRSRVSADMMHVFEIAVRYQMYHALALLIVGQLATRTPTSAMILSGWLLTVGTIIFSGTLYLLVLSEARWWGAITPLGGLALLAGWIALGWALYAGEVAP